MIRQNPSERGQVLVIVVLAIVGLVGMTGLAIDGSRAYSDRRRAQNAADTAALAASLANIRGDADWLNVGYSRATSNGYDNNGTTNIVNVYNPPIQGPYTGDTNYVQVIITSHLDTLFGRVVGVEQVTNTVEAVARVDPSVWTSLYDGNAVVGLAPHDCKAVKFQGTANTTLEGGGLFVNSDCDNAAFFNNSSSASLTAPSLTVVGDETHADGALENVGTITENASEDAHSYPPSEYILPNPDCTENATKTGETLSAGNWSGTFPPAGVKYLESGVYCVNSGNFRLNASDYLEGHGVVIWMNSGDVRWNGGATVKLYAPDTGPYKGLLLYMPITNTNEIVVNGNSDSEFEGTFLAPAAPITINGTGGTNGLNGQVIGYTVDLGGTSGIKIKYDNSNAWETLTTPSIDLMQ